MSSWIHSLFSSIFKFNLDLIGEQAHNKIKD